MSNLMLGSSSYLLGTNDTADVLLNNISPMDANQPNGLADGIIQVQAALGPGTDLVGALDNLSERLAVQMPADRRFRWMHSGSDPYANSEEDAFSDAKLDHWLVCNQDRIPEADRAEIKRLLRIPGAGQLVLLREGDRLETMMSGNELRQNVEVQLGREQRALRFDMTVNGHHYVFVLPLGCWNWSLGPDIQASAPAVAVEDDCAIIMAPVIPGQDVARVAVSVRSGERVPSTCWAQQVEGEWVAWPGACDDCSWAEAHSAVPGWRERRLMEPGTWVATERFMVLRVPRVVADRGYVGFCIERRGHRGHSNTIWVEPGDWHKPEYRYTVQTPWTWID
jgi:hypothetical protein